MEVVLLVVVVGKRLEKCLRLCRALQLLCQLPQGGHPHTDDPLRVHGGHQLGLKLPVVQILEGKQLFLYGVHIHTPSAVMCSQYSTESAVCQACSFQPRFRSLHTPWVMVPMGQKEHQVLGR